MFEGVLGPTFFINKLNLLASFLHPPTMSISKEAHLFAELLHALTVQYKHPSANRGILLPSTKGQKRKKDEKELVSLSVFKDPSAEIFMLYAATVCTYFMEQSSLFSIDRRYINLEF